jgi:hypothetical protein
MSATVAQVRSAGAHYDITKFLMPPSCSDCFNIHVTSLDWSTHEVTADVTVKNFTKALTGYDVRGIVYPLGNYILKNAYAYTLLHAPPGVLDPSGFRAFNSSDPDRSIGPGESSIETFVVGFPDGAKFIDIVFAVDACWPDHCPEAYDISGFEQSDLDLVPGAQADVSVYVADWQNDTKKVTIDTDILGGTEMQLTQVSGDLWAGPIANVLGIPPGEYPALITARDQVAVNNLYQRVTLKVIDASDQEPPTWISDVGIMDAQAGLDGILVKFGLATDPSMPVTYNLYWVEGGTLDFDTANKVTGITDSPYLLSGLSPGLHTLAVRAQDAYGNETTNTNTLGATVGLHPNVYWVSGPPMATARAWSGGFLDGGFFWVLGGYSFGTSLKNVEKYDVVKKEWSSPWSLPEPRDSFGCGALDGKAYIFGGRFAETEVTDTCEIIELATGIVYPLPPTLPFARAGCGTALLDGVFYITGGRAFTGSDWQYYRETLTFTPPSTDFGPETDLEIDTAMMGFAAGDSYMMTCGGNPERTDVLYHKPGTKSWQFVAPLDLGRESNCAVWVKGWLFSIGGSWIEHATAGVEAMDVAGNVWYEINPLLNPRFGAVAATDGSYIYVAGGMIAAGPAWIPLDTFEIGQIF